jgi:hypothetical protein
MVQLPRLEGDKHGGPQRGGKLKVCNIWKTVRNLQKTNGDFRSLYIFTEKKRGFPFFRITRIFIGGGKPLYRLVAEGFTRTGKE